MLDLNLKIKFLIFILLTSLTHPINARVPDAIDWSTVDFAEEDHFLDKIQRGISDALFGVVGGQLGYTGWPYENRFSLGFNINRKVYSNLNAEESYTVIDTFYLPAFIPVNMVSLGNNNFSLNLGIGISAKAMNLRQVKPEDFDLLTSTRDLEASGRDILVKDYPKDKIDRSDEPVMPPSINELWEGDSLPLPINKENSSTPLKKRRNFFNDDPKLRARYSHIWNLLENPFRLPLTEKAVWKLDVGEISSYDLSGYISLSATVGWSAQSFDPGFLGNSFTPFSVTASIGTYLKGNFRVSVLKMSEKKVRLKVARNKAVGLNFNVRAGTGAFRPLEGIVLINNLLSIDIVPFNLSVSAEMAEQFDVGYSYDLENPNALKAFLKAVRGDLIDSEVLSQEKDGVSREFTRNISSDSLYINQSLKISFLYSSSRTLESRFTEILIEFPDGKKRIFKGYIRVNRSQTSLFGSEDTSQSFLATFEDDLDNNPDGNFTAYLPLRINGHFIDSNSTGVELSSYMSKIQKIIGDRLKLPAIPIVGPRTRCRKRQRVIGRNGHVNRRIPPEDVVNGLCKTSRKLISYGQSTFFYRMGFNRNLVDKFINFPEEKMWPILEKGFDVKPGDWETKDKRIRYGFRNVFQTFFNIPAFVLANETIKSGSNLFSAEIFYKKWKELKTVSKDSKTLAIAFQHLFKTYYYGYELTRTVLEALKGEKFQLQLSAHNEATFGNIDIIDDDFENDEPTDRRMTDIIDFDSERNIDIVDQIAVIDDYRLGRYENEVVLFFKLHKIPKYLYIKVDRANYLSPRKHLNKIVYNNKDGRFKIGENLIRIKKDEDDPLKKPLAELLFDPKSRLVVGIAVSNNSKQWGYLYEKKIDKYKTPKR